MASAIPLPAHSRRTAWTPESDSGQHNDRWMVTYFARALSILLVTGEERWSQSDIYKPPSLVVRKQMSNLYDPLPSNIVEKVADILAHTDTGFTGSEIGRLLDQCNIDDLRPTDTKRHRLREALLAKQGHDHASNAIIKFLTEAMAPSRYFKDHTLFESRQSDLNQVLAFVGLKIRDDGKVGRTEQASTLSEAAKLANRLHTELNRRCTHVEVLNYCQEEILNKDLFHAVFEAVKGLAERIRQMTGLTGDGGRLIDRALAAGGTNMPILAINNLQTETERSEQNGLVNLTKGVFGMFRNVTAHAPRITWPINEADALDIFTTLSLIHRRLDSAQVNPAARQ